MCILLASLPTSMAEQITKPTYQYVKIFVDPFYLEEMQGNIDHVFTLDFYPPNDVGSVTSTILTFHVLDNPSIRYYLWVNDQTCNPSSYYLSTSFANAEEHTIAFDCSNVITKEGTYTIKLQPDEDTGTTRGWADITYTNQEEQSLNIFGTEYRTEDNNAKVFLQLLDSARHPIENASCYATIYYPNTTVWIDRSLMNYVDEGLHHLDVSLGTTFGVYMVSAFCDTPSTTNVSINDNIESGTFSGGSGWDGAWTGTGEIKSDKSPFGIYHLKFDDNEYLERNFTLDQCDIGYLTFYAKAEDFGNIKEYCTWSYFNGSTYIPLLNITDGFHDDETYRYYSYDICQYNFTGNQSFIMEKSEDGKDCWTDNIDIQIQNYFNESTYERIRGSGEIHVNDWFNNYTQHIANEVWTWENRTLTDFNFTVNATVDLGGISAEIDNLLKSMENANSSLHSSIEGLNLSIQLSIDGLESDLLSVNNTLLSVNQTLYDYISLVPEMVWLFQHRNITSFEFDVINEPLVAEYVWNYTSRELTVTFNNLSADEVWNYNNRNITYFPDLVDEDQIADTVWNYENRNLTYINFSEVLTSINSIPEDVWNYTTRTLTGFSFLVDLTTESIADIWSYSERNLTYYEVTQIDEENIARYVWNSTTRELTQSFSNITPEEVWIYANRNLTYYPDPVDYNLVQQYVWNATTRELTQIFNDITAEEVWSYLNRNLTYYEVTDVEYDLISDYVWNETDRQLTSFNFDVVDEETIAGYVWNDTTRTLTVTFNNLSASDVWSYANRNITYYPDLVNESAVAEAVWSYLDRTLTVEFSNLTADDVWLYANRNLTYYEVTQIDYELLSDYVWNETDRQLTAFNFDVVDEELISDYNWNASTRTLTVEFSNITSDEIWNYANRNLTDFGFDVVNESEIADSVWNYFNRTLTDFGFTVNATVDLSGIPSDVWSYFNRTLSDFGFDVVNESEVAQSVWEYTDRQLTVTFSNITADEIWAYANRNLTSFDFDVVDEELIANYVWNDTTRTLTVTYTNITEGDIWNYTTRTLTEFPTINATLVDFPFDVVDEALVSDYVWNNTVRELTVEFSNLTAQQVWEYVNRSLTEFNFVVDANISTTDVADAVWNYANRNLTYIDFSSVLTAINQIPDLTWTYSNRNITDFTFDVVDENLVAEYVWNYSNRESNATNINFSEVIIQINGIKDDVWNYENRNLTHYPTVNASLVSFPFDVVNESEVAMFVWDYHSRTLTEFNFTVDTTINLSELENITAIIDPATIWAYENRSLTDFCDGEDSVGRCVWEFFWRAGSVK